MTTWQVITGDCLDILPTLEAGSVDAVITDPPYMFGAASVSGNGNSKIGKWADLMNQSYFYTEVINQARHVLAPDSCIWMFINWRGLPVIMKAAVEAGAHIDSVLVWDKCWIGPGGNVGLRPSYELVVLIPFGNFAIANRGLPDIWRHKWSSHKPSGHPSEKPETLLYELVNETTEGVVLDPFMGSGTTGVACMQTGRNFIGIEIDPGYADISRERIGKAAEQARQLPLLEAA